MTITIPILNNHDHTKPIGVVVLVDGRLEFRFHSDMEITIDMVYHIFGNAGFKILEQEDREGVILIRSGQILEWSFSLFGSPE